MYIKLNLILICLSAPLIASQTITALTPEQSSAIINAQNSYMAGLSTDPNFVSIGSEIATATDSSVIDVLQSIFEPSPTETDLADQESAEASLISELPTDIQAIFQSVTSEVAEISSSVLAAGSASAAPSGVSFITETGSGTVTGTGSSAAPTGVTIASSSPSASKPGSSSSSSKAAAPTAGINIGISGVLAIGAAAAVAML